MTEFGIMMTDHNLNHCLDFNVPHVVTSSGMFLQFWKDTKIW